MPQREALGGAVFSYPTWYSVGLRAGLLVGSAIGSIVFAVASVYAVSDKQPRLGIVATCTLLLLVAMLSCVRHFPMSLAILHDGLAVEGVLGDCALVSWTEIVVPRGWSEQRGRLSNYRIARWLGYSVVRFRRPQARRGTWILIGHLIRDYDDLRRQLSSHAVQAV
jgi:hypothetical protein